MVYGACYYIVDTHETSKSGNNLWDMSYFGFLLGNCMLTFMWHHSLPNLVRPVRPEKDINKMIFFSDLMVIVILLIVVYSAVFAFGGLTNSCDDSYPCEI